MKSVLTTFLLLATAVCFGQRTDLKTCGFKGKVKEVSIKTYKYLQYDPPDSVLQSITKLVFNQNGNLISEVGEGVTVPLTVKKVYTYNSSGEQTGYEVYMEDTRTAVVSFSPIDAYTIEQVSESLPDGRKTKYQIFYNKDYTLSKVVVSENHFVEYTYDEADDLVNAKTVINDETDDLLVAQTRSRDEKGNPRNVTKANIETMFTPIVEHYTFTYYPN